MMSRHHGLDDSDGTPESLANRFWGATGDATSGGIAGVKLSRHQWTIDPLVSNLVGATGYSRTRRSR